MELPLNNDGEDVAPVLNADVVDCDVWGLVKTLFTALDVPNTLGCPKTDC